MKELKNNLIEGEAKKNKIPLWIKISFTAFMAVLVPVYTLNYGPTNFLYFCDVALFLTLIAVWTEKALPASMAAVGIIVPQLFWCIDFLFELSGHHLTSMTHYMFRPELPLFLRGLSLFHGWIPFLLSFLVLRLGYDSRGFKYWTLLAVGLCLISYFLLPSAGAVLADPKTPRNVNYVFGFSETQAQQWVSAPLYLMGWISALIGVIYWPTHKALKYVSTRRAA